MEVAALSDRPKRTMPNLDCTSIPSKFQSKTDLKDLGFEVFSGAETTSAMVARRNAYNNECKTTGKHFATYVLTDQFVLKEDLTIFKNKHDYAYMLADPGRTSSFWMVPVAALADCKQFKALTQEERAALTVDSVCCGIPVGQHLYEALTTSTPKHYTLVSAASHKRTHSAEPVEDGHHSKKNKHEDDGAPTHDDEVYASEMEKITCLKVPDEVPPPSPNKADEQPTFLKRVIAQLRKPPTASLTRGQFVALAAVNSLTRADARKTAAAADTDQKTSSEWQAALSKEKPTFFDTVCMMSNAQDVVMTAVSAVHAGEMKELVRINLNLTKELDSSHNEQSKANEKAATLQKERDVCAATVVTLKKELEAKQAKVAELTEELSSAHKDQSGHDLLASFLVDE